MTFPQTPNLVDIEIYYDAGWHNINQYVYHEGMSPITITRGRTSEGRNCDPGVMTLVLNNRDGRFSPRNPSSALFGKIGRNTPIRVSVTYNAVTYVRFVGEVTSWPSRWDVSQRDIWVPIEAAGILRRLGQGTKPLRSPMYRTMIGVSANDYVPHAYWPMEDGPSATTIASALPGGLPLAATGVVDMASEASLSGSDPLLTLEAGASLLAAIPTYTDTGQWVVQFLFQVPVEPVAASITLAEIFTTGGTIGRYRITLTPGADPTPSTLAIAAFYGASGAQASSANAPLTDETFYGRWFTFALSGFVNGSSQLQYNLHFFDAIDTSEGPYGNVEAATVPGVVTSIKLSATEDIHFGHLALFVDPNFDLEDDVSSVAPAMYGHNGESVEDRLNRLCTQSQLPFTLSGAAPALMGSERVVTLLQALRDAEATDQGFLFETRDSLGLQYRTNSSRYNQTAIALDYDVGHISSPFDPEPDDRNVANDREVKRRNGSSARRELTSGPLSVQDPPDGVGRYDDSITVDAYTDDQLEHIAGWRLHIGTWDAERYPRVAVNLAVAGNASIIPAIAGADSGDLITIANLPAWLPPETCELLVEGYRENIGFYTWDFIFACSPAGPYNVVGVWGLMGQELHTAMNTSVTSADIATTSGPLLATSLGSGGYTAKIGAEEIQVTAVAASTVTFGTTGTVAHAVNANVTPGIPASVATGDLLLVFAAIRNSGTGVPNTPSGYTRLAAFASTDNCQLFAKIATSGAESAPAISFTGGVANADTSAQMIRLSGKWHSAANVLLDANTQVNASAQNINYPGLMVPMADNCIILYLAWKQDDWTSVTGPGTEIGEPDTTTGDDQGIAWYYAIQTTAAAIGPSAIVVTGGGAAISRSAVVALRCDYQTATITRSVNGVSASHSAADAVTLARPSRWALV